MHTVNIDRDITGQNIMQTVFSLAVSLAVFLVAAMVAAMAAHVNNTFGAGLMLIVGAMGAVFMFVACND